MNKEKKNYLLNEVSSQFIPFYHSLGFVFDRRIMEFKKNEQIVLLEPEAEYEAKIIFAISLSTQHEEIRLIKDKIFPEIPSSLTTYKLQENVLDITRFGYKQFYKGWSISNSSDIIAMFKEHKLFMENCGFKFLTRFSNLNSIHENLNLKVLNNCNELKNTTKNELKGYIGEREILSGLITAFLIDFDGINRLIECYKNLYQSNNMNTLIDKVSNYFKDEAR